MSRLHDPRYLPTYQSLLHPPVYIELPSGKFEAAPASVVVDPADVQPILFPIVSRDLVIQARYENMRLNGESHNMAEMLASRSFPGVKTDAIFNEGKFSGDQGRIGPQELWRIQQAEAAGVSTAGKWYCSGLASFPGDPTAWVGDRGDVLRVAREKNLKVSGYVECESHETYGGEDLPIANELVEDEVNDILESNPHANADDVREEVYALRTGAVDSNPLLCEDHFTTDIP